MSPWDMYRSPGGSSGGEAGLISLGCSPLGMGSDGAGSVRIPALNVGIYGFKPSKERWPMKGHVEAGGYGNWCISVTGGPLSQSVDDIKLFLGSTLNSSVLRKHKISECQPVLEWSDEKYEGYKKSIKKFAYLPQLEEYPLCPTNKRALYQVVTKLRDAGYQVEEVNYPADQIKNIQEAFLINSMISQIGRIASIEGEQIIPEFLIINLAAILPTFVKKI